MHFEIEFNFRIGLVLENGFVQLGNGDAVVSMETNAYFL